MVCKKCGRCCQEFSYGLNRDEAWVQKLVKLLEIMRLNSLLKIVKEVKIIMRCKYLDKNDLCKIYEKRPKRCRDFLCRKARVDKKEVKKLTKEEYRKKIIEILDEFLEVYGELTLGEIEGVVDKIMAVPIPEEGKKTDNSRFVVHGTYFPHDDKKKIL